jgi:alcohol-forming fatty acyl-CoA reductase
MMVHFSTAFCCCDQEVLEEKIFDWSEKPQKLIDLAEKLSEDEMLKMQSDLLGVHPNTYTYTKRMAEVLIRDEYAKGFPVCIVRPSVVTPAYQEPIPGWVDSLNGPAGLMIGAGKGVIRSMLLDGKLGAELVPVDVAVNGVILIAKEIATRHKK